MILEILVMLLILQFSCATPKREQGYKEPPVPSGQAQAAATIINASLLGDKHQANGCHAATVIRKHRPPTTCPICLHGLP